MSVSSISSLTPAATALLPLNRPSAPAPTLPAPTNASPAPPPAAVAASASAPAKATSSVKSTPSGGGGSGGSSSSAPTDASYTTNVAGKTYSGTVQYSDGQYVVSIPALSGAVATGSSAQSAEDNLGNIISVLA